MLAQLVQDLAEHPAVREKHFIEKCYAEAESVSHNIPLGDDCAAIPDPSGDSYTLFAAEGILSSFAMEDPWFAGYSAVMVNLSDVAAMGGRPTAITDVIWSSDSEISTKIWQGMRAASEAYQVPIVGGHTTHTDDPNPYLSAAVIGRAGQHLLTSFDAEEGDRLLIAIDMEAAYRNDKPFWNASTTSTPEHLKNTLELLPTLAEKKLSKAAKDISNGGIIGTLSMLCHCSKVGATIQLQDLPRPQDTPWLKWLTTFPIEKVMNHFSEHSITCTDIGYFTPSPELVIQNQRQSLPLHFI